MDTESQPTVESSAPAPVEPPLPVEQAAPASTSPSGWTLVVASVAIAVAVLLILGIGFGVGYLLDQRNGVDTLGVQRAPAQCATNT